MYIILSFTRKIFFPFTGKWWGNKNIQPIIAVHGWHDNAGTWDPVCELLPDNFSVLSIDFPGHGLSSHLPSFLNYYHNDSISVVRRIKKHYGMDKIDLLGHSEGSAACFTYATVFPEDVDSYFGVDYVTNCYLDNEERAVSLGDRIDEKISIALRNEASTKTYLWEDAKRTWHKAFPWSLTEKSTEILMKRGVLKMPDGKYKFSRDQRLKTYDPSVFTLEQTHKLVENIKCHVRLVRGMKSILFNTGLKFYPDILEIIEKNAKSFKLYEIDEDHHLHMDVPELFLPLLFELFGHKQGN